jgi:hypothetical protein
MVDFGRQSQLLPGNTQSIFSASPISRRFLQSTTQIKPITLVQVHLAPLISRLSFA